MPIDSQTLKYSPPKRKRSGKYLRCKHCNREFYLSPHRVNRGERYCSRECQIASKKVTKVCPVCGKDFEVNQSIQDRYTVCSKECRLANTKYQICKRCGKSFNNPEKRYDRHYCSEECRRPPVYINCATCGIKFRKLPGDKDRRFCSISCYRKSNGENLLEKTIRIALDNIGINYIQEAKMGRYSVDFLLVDHRIALEIDGVYWHSDSKRDKRKDKFLTRKGWNVIRITDKEIDNAISIPDLIVDHINS
jgi:very-short-patch-repair endonuclease